MGITSDLIYIVLAALAGGLLAHALRQPLIFGYILAGVVVGPHTGGVTVRGIDQIEELAEIGVALLLFAIGLEFSFADLRRLARISFVGTPLQIVTAACLGYLLACYAGLNSREAIWFGAALSLSSTMVVVKLLESRQLLGSTTARTGIAILIAQDLALLPIMLIVPQLTRDTVHIGALLLALGQSALILLAILIAGHRSLPKFLRFVARQGSRELLFLTTLGIAFGTGALFHAVGFSFPLGAFVAGMLLGETDLAHQARQDITGLRDLFALVFFASIGMLFNPSFFISNITTIASVTIGVIAIKTVLVALIVRFFAAREASPLAVGLSLSQIGEFAFVIAATGLATGQLSHHSFDLLLGVTLLSMSCTPALLGVALRLKSAQ